MTITGTTVVKGVLVLMSVVLLISFFFRGFCIQWQPKVNNDVYFFISFATLS